MPQRTGSRRFPQKIVALEDGRFFDDWTIRTTGSALLDTGVVADFQGFLISHRNNSGAGAAIGEFRLPYATFSLDTNATYEDQHTVHLRVTRENSGGASFALCPATAVKPDVGLGQGYFVQARDVTGTPTIEIHRLILGTDTLLASAAGTIKDGDILSLAYRWEIGTSEAHLSAMINGTSVLTFSETLGAGGLRMANGRQFGIYGDETPSIPNTQLVGHTTSEWWVCDGWETFEEPESRSELFRGLRVSVVGRQRWTSDATPTIGKMFSGELIRGEWTHKRIGGPSSLSCEIRYPEVRDPPGSAVLKEQLDSAAMDDPKGVDWETSNWLGGHIIVDLRHQPFNLESYTLTAGEIPTNPDTVWRGIVSSVTWDPKTKKIGLQAHGLSVLLDRVFFSGTFTDTTIRDIITTVISTVAQEQEPAAGVFGYDTQFRYNPTKIIGTQSAFDLRLDMEFQRESVSSILTKLFEFMPQGASWGIDNTGDFYVDQQLDHYTTGLTEAGIQHFTVDNQAVKMKKTTDLDQVRTSVVVLGAELTEQQGLSNILKNLGSPEGRVFAVATSERARQLFGWREQAVLDDALTDVGLASKVAAAQLKKLCVPAISGEMEVRQPIRGDKELLQVANAPPRVSVDDRQNVDKEITFSIGGPTGFLEPRSPGVEFTEKDYGGPVSEQITTTEYVLRRFGDTPAFCANDKGSSAANIRFSSTALEKALNLSFFIHLSLRFDFPHPGSSGDLCFLFGRVDDPGDGFGWGALWWEHLGGSTGRLVWKYTNNGGTDRDLLPTGNVDPAGTGTVVHFTIWRDASGNWKVYNGNTLTTQTSAFAADVLQNIPGNWRFLKHNRNDLPANYLNGDVAFDEFRVFSSVNIENNESGGVLTEIAESNDTRLARNRTEGLLIYAPFDFGASASGDLKFPFHRGPYNVDPGSAAPGGYEGTWTRSGVGGTGNGTPVTSGTRRGVQVGVNPSIEKKWGGPLIFDVHTTTYQFDVGSGILVRKFKLGRPPIGVFAELAVLKDEIRRIEESRRRTPA